MSEITFDVGTVTETLTLKVRGRKRLALRGWLAAKLIELAALVLGSRLSLELLSGGDFDEQDLPPAFDGAPFRRFVEVAGHAIPTAASVREGPLYDPAATVWGQHIDVLLDGVVQNEVVSFDMDGGWLRRFKKNADGENYRAGDDIATEVLRGEIELRPRA